MVAGPHLRTPRALTEKLEVLERSAEMVLAAHFTPVGRLTATTVETVRFERPRRVTFRLVRGPVPHVTETYELTPVAAGTRLEYAGEMGADLWRLRRWWCDRVAGPWERTVSESLDEVRIESRAPSRALTVGP